MDAARNGWAVERLEERLSGERDGGGVTGFGFQVGGWSEWKLSCYQAGGAGPLGDAVGWVYSGRLPKRT